ncbi:hypothetical protein J7E62_10590 [Variovorax paradoxus]|nr:hypothetical protein [Variovorax paradoxus]
MEDLSSPAARRTKRSFAHWIAAAFATAAIGSMLTPIPASADQNERNGGKRAPTVLATPPFFLETNQIGSCTLVNLGTVPRDVTLTYHTEETQSDGTPTPDQVTTFTIEPTLDRARQFPAFPPSRSLTPVPAYCKFESADTSLLRGGGYAATDGVLGSAARAVAAE